MFNLIVSAIAFGLAIHSKSLGLPLALISAAVFTGWYVLNRRNWWHWLTFALILLAFYAPLHFTHSTIAQHTENLAQAVKAPEGMVYVGTYNAYVERNIPVFLFGAHGFLARLFNYADFGLLYFALIIFTALNWRKVWPSNLKYLLAIILLDLVVIGWALYQPQLYPLLIDGTLCTRMFMAVAPTALYCCFLIYDDKHSENSLLARLGEAFSNQLIGKDRGK